MPTMRGWCCEQLHRDSLQQHKYRMGLEAFAGFQSVLLLLKLIDELQIQGGVQKEFFFSRNWFWNYLISLNRYKVIELLSDIISLPSKLHLIQIQFSLLSGYAIGDISRC